jgi:hypothetical protein
MLEPCTGIILSALGIGGFVIACLLFLSIFGDDIPKAIAPRPMFLVNLLSLALLVVLAVRFGEWLGFQITVEEFGNIPKTSGP